MRKLFLFHGGNEQIELRDVNSELRKRVKSRNLDFFFASLYNSENKVKIAKELHEVKS